MELPGALFKLKIEIKIKQPEKKNSLCSKKWNFLAVILNFLLYVLIFWETENPKKISYIHIWQILVPRTSPKDSIWLSQGRPNLTSLRRPKMRTRGSPNLTFKGRPWDVVSGSPQGILRTSPRGSPEYLNLDVPSFFLTFLSKLIRLTKSI